MCDECTWHHKTILVESVYWHLAVKLHCYACFPLNIRSSVSHSLSAWMPLSVFGYVVTDCTCIGTSLDPRFSLSFSLSVSVSGYMIGKSARIRKSLDLDFFVSLCLWMRVAVSDYIMTDCRCKCTPLDSCYWLSFSLNVSISVRLYWHWF